MQDLPLLYAPLLNYIPQTAHKYILELIERHPIQLKITAPRKTLLGSYKRNNRGEDQISINGDLNPYSFLITLLHEFAHLKAFDQYGFSIEPHGPEWQKTFSNLLSPLLSIHCFPDEINDHLLKKNNQLSASQCTDPILYGYLKKYDCREEGVKLLRELCIGDHFSLSNGMQFKKLKINRTRAVCRRIDGHQAEHLFTISLLAEVYPI